MSETSVKIIKNEIRCRDDTYISGFWGCGRLLHVLNLTLQWLLVSTVFGTVSSLHLISFLMIFTLVYLCVQLSAGVYNFLEIL